MNLSNFGAHARGYLVATLQSAPWIAVAILGYLFIFSDVKNADLNLAFQAYKACIAMVLTSLCDRGLFYMVPQELDSLAWAPQIRRAVIFVGICLLLQIA